MSEDIIVHLLNGSIDLAKFTEWLSTKDLNDDTFFTFGDYQCSRSDFVINFMAYVKHQTDSILQVNSDANQSESSSKSDQNDPFMKGIQPLSPKMLNSTGDSTVDHTNFNEPMSPNPAFRTQFENRTLENRTPKEAALRMQSSENRTPNPPRAQSCENRHEIPVPRLNTSEPDRRHYQFSPVFPANASGDGPRFSTPKNPSSVRKCNFDTPPYENRAKHRVRTPVAEKTTLNLGDFILNSANQDKQSGKKKRAQFKTPDGDKTTTRRVLNSTPENDFNVLDHDAFPAIGGSAREKRRINPTKILMNPVHSGAFRTERILEENDAFKHQKLFQPEEKSIGYEVERSILKQERHKLMEKFNILSSNADSLKMKSRTNSYKNQTITTQANKSYVDPDVSKIVFKAELDILSDIYSIILDRNFVLNLCYELYYLMSIVVIKQLITDNTNELCTMNQILKSIHNCVYFAVATLWRQRNILAAFLDKSSLRIISRNKRIMDFSTDLTDYLTNLYQYWVENDAVRASVKSGNVVVPEPSFSDRNVCFVSETDGVENFPAVHNFSNFRKQRDMFYDIFRHWESKHTKPEFSAIAVMPHQIKSLLMIDSNPTNLAHLARLFTQQMISSCLYHGKDKATQEEMAMLKSEIGTNLTPDKLSKLAKRLEGAQRDVGSLKAGFPGTQEFFRDFIVCAESAVFRDHLRDCIASRLLEQDGSVSFSHCENIDRDRNFDNALCEEFVHNLKTLQVLGKFLGFIVCLSYVHPSDTSYLGNRKTEMPPGRKVIAPKDAVLSSDLAVRDQIQPPIDLLRALNNAQKYGRMTVTIPWIVEYMSMLDYTAFRLPCYKKVICLLFFINSNLTLSESMCAKCTECKLRDDSNLNQCSDCSYGDNKLKTRTMENSYILGSFNKDSWFIVAYTSAVLIKMCLGVLFENAYFPQDLFYAWSVKRYVPIDRPGPELSISLCSIADVAETNVTTDDGSEMMSRVDAMPLLKEWAFRDICPFVRDIFVLLNSCQSNGDRRQSTYRHITPVSVQPEVPAKSKEKELQTRLLEQFLRSQPSSTRRTIDFVSERVSSVIIKRLVATHIAHSKLKASSSMAACVLDAKRSSAEDSDLSKRLLNIVNEVTRNTIDKCNCVAASMARRKSITALKALLPEHQQTRDKLTQIDELRSTNTSDTYIYRIAAKYTTRRVENWLNEHCTPAIYCKDLDGHLKALLAMKMDVLTTMASNSSSPPVSPSDEEDVPEISDVPAPALVKDTLLVASNTFEDDNVSPTIVLVELNDLLWLCLQNSGSQAADAIEASLMATLRLTSRCMRPTNLFIEMRSKKIMGQLSIDLVIFLVCFQPSLLTDSTLELFTSVWNEICQRKSNCHSDDESDDDALVRRDLDDLRLESPTEARYEISDDDGDAGSKASLSQKADSYTTEDPLVANRKTLPNSEFAKDLPVSNISSDPLEDTDCLNGSATSFDRILCPRNILLTVQSGAENLPSVWNAMGNLIIFLLKQRFLDEESLTEQCLAIYRQDWPQIILENLAHCMHRISAIHKPSAGSRGAKFKIFLNFLAEYCDNMEPSLS